MQSFVIACLCFAATINARLKPEPRIIGGHLVKIENFPYQVYLKILTLYDEWQCGASILNRDKLLTAAHCVIAPRYDNILTIMAHAGSADNIYGGQQIRLADVHPHPLYDGNDISNDIAVVRLEKLLTLNRRVKPIPLAERLPEPGAMLSVAGWGTQSDSDENGSQFLYATKVPIVSKHECLKNYKDFKMSIPTNTFCAGYLNDTNKDTCKGDSGGAITYNGQQVGVVSWGYGCGKTGRLGVYTDITKYKTFIRNHLNTDGFHAHRATISF